MATSSSPTDSPKPQFVDKTISYSSPDFMKEVVSLVLAVKPSWEGKSLNTTLLSYGTCISNKLVACFYGDEVSNETGILVRINGVGTEKIIDRDNENKILGIISSIDCLYSTKLLALFQNGICHEFLNGVTVDENTVRDPNISKLIAIQIAKLHHFGPKPDSTASTLSCETSTAKFLANFPGSFEDTLKQKSFETFPPILALENEIQSVFAAINALNLPTVLCHNDLLLSNIIYDKVTDQVKLIDFEYSGYNSNCYDIGNHFTAYAGIIELDYSRYPDKAYQFVWLRHYLEHLYFLQNKDPKNITEAEHNKLYVGVNLSALASHLYWGLWSLYQASNSGIDFDFLGYGKIRIDEYFAKKDQFFSLLDLIK